MQLPLRTLLPVAVLLLCSCASGASTTRPAAPTASPAAPSVSPAAPAAAAPAAPKAAHICHPKASFVSFTSLGVPEDEHPADLLSTDDYDYVLFEPARLLRLSREAGKVKVEMVLGQVGTHWKAIALDPVDGSVWVGTDEFTLVRVSPSLRQTKVPLQRVTGTGGFVRLVVARDAIYAAPACAAEAVWRIDRAGKILGSAFLVMRDPDQPLPSSMVCSNVRLDRDPEGHVVAWDSQKLHRADQGVWSEVDSGVFASLPDSRVLKGVDVGTANEQWYFNGAAGLFLWKGQPVFLGSPTIHNLGKGSDTILLVPRAGQAHELIESCFGASVLRVASTPSRYAALIRKGIILGDFATAPDLP
jgi:hypothetical protein